MNPKTVVTEEYNSEFYTTSPDLCDGRLVFEIQGQTPERSYEDRSVYVRIKELKTPLVPVNDEPVECGSDELCIQPTHSLHNEFVTWFNGEEAIELGEMLIRHGRKALVANMIQHQAIHHRNQLRQYVADDRVEYLVFKVIDENPANHGDGFRTYNIMPVWNEDEAPQYDEDFNYDEVIYWSMFDKEYQEQLKRYGAPIEFIGYDRDAEVEAFYRGGWNE